MKRTVPLLITASVGFLLIATSFIPAAESWGEWFLICFDILAGIAFILGGGNLVNAQLRKISNRRAGWGYALVTLVSFLVTLGVGLFKVGVGPAPNQEFFGEFFATLAPQALPEFSVAASISQEMRDRSLPASVRRQTTLTAGGITVRGWLSPAQSTDLKEFEPTLEWKCAVERLAEQAQPPEPLRGRVAYYPDHTALSFRGYMTPEDEQALREISPNSAELTSAVDQLAAQSRRETWIAVADPPSGLELPASLSSVVTLEDGRLTMQGPMSVAQRNQLVDGALAARRILPGDSANAEAFLRSLANAGPLNEKQTEAVRRRLSENLSLVLIAVVNTAGVSAPREKTACQLLEERNAGATELNAVIPPGPPVVLNAEQQRIIRESVGTGIANWTELKEQLAVAGPVTPAQLAAIDEFRNQLPTEGQRNRALFGELVKLGPLTASQRELLLKPFREEYRWRMTVLELFMRCHQVKYPWSGVPLEQGSAFWWLYEYVMQPITSMLFALLAFYVASAAFRAFRAKNLEATLLLGTAFIILLGRTYAGVLLTGWLPDALAPLRLENLSVFLMSAFNTAGNRAIMIGIALGIASTSLKILLGIDRSHIGGKE